MSRIIYFPLISDQFSHQIGIKSLAPGNSLLERTDRFEDELKLKRDLLSNDPHYYACSTPQSAQAEEEVSMMLTQEPEDLIETSKKIQEDLIILSGDASMGHPIIAGIVCFPNGWTITEKIGQGIDKVHEPVPEYAEVMSGTVNRMLERLKSGRTLWRCNWAVKPSSRLDQSPKSMPLIMEEKAELTSENVSEKCFFRVEKQTLTRLPKTQTILFTILTDQVPVAELEKWQQSNLLGVLRSCPQRTLKYKGISSFCDLLCNDLDKRIK
ncbi:MAG: DUF3445 domain-containing protein [Verrucomicrobiaceae bacterium]|nr:MAG: DUF3445 domain-containing protein [Verrucomicrobiaceae bacterium]